MFLLDFVHHNLKKNILIFLNYSFVDNKFDIVDILFKILKSFIY